MKKVLVALAMVLGTGSSVVFAQEVNNSSAVVAEAQVPQDEFVKMDPTELPQAILLTLAKNYEGSSVKEAYVKVKDEAKIYKIIILTQDGQETEDGIRDTSVTGVQTCALPISREKRIPVRDESEFLHITTACGSYQSTSCCTPRRSRISAICSNAQPTSDSMCGIKLCPISVREYSTRGGTSAYTFLMTSPSVSNERSVTVSIRCEMSPIVF